MDLAWRGIGRSPSGAISQVKIAALIVTYHPAYLLRNLPDKAKARADLCFARDPLVAIQKS
jgi:DNA polymerase